MAKPLPIKALKNDPALALLIAEKLARNTPHGLLADAPSPRPLFVARAEIAEYAGRSLRPIGWRLI